MAVTATDLNALAKEVYSDKVVNLIPENMRVCKDYKFKEAKSVGDKFIQPTKMTHEHGFTYSTEDSVAFSLNAAVPAIFKEAQVDGSSIVLRSALSYVQLARLDNKAKSFMTAPSALLEDMNQSMYKRIEVSAIYGRSTTGLGVIASVGGETANQEDLTFTDASWAPGIWAGSEGAYVDWVTSAGVKDNTYDVKIVSVDIATKTITVEYDASESTNPVATDYIVWKGALDVEPIGIDRIVNNTGTLYGIDASAYSLWKSTVTTSVGALTLAGILEIVDTAINKGLEGDVNVYMPARAFTALSNEQSALRRFDGSYSKEGKASFKGLQFYHQSGMLSIKPSIYVKEGDVFVCPVEGGNRIGASDVTFNTPGMKDEKLFHQLEESAGVGIRCFSHQAVFFDKPAHLAKGEGVTYS